MAAAARNVAARSIHVKIYPTARNLTERREVLRVLERFGEVEMFKSLKYDPINPVANTFLSIFSTEEAVRAAIEASPIRYRLIADPVHHPNTSAVAAAESSSPSPISPTPSVSESLFELHISPSTYDHHAAIASSPLHNTYTPVSPLRSFITADLSTRVPQSIAKAGLVDWVTGSARIISGERSASPRKAAEADLGEVLEGQSVARSQKGRVTGLYDINKPWRLRGREQAERERDVPWVMRGLKSKPQTNS